MERKEWSFYLLAALLCALGVLLLGLPWHLAKVAGDALIIAAVLAVTVDTFLKERFLREVSRDVAKYLIGYSLPQELQNKIQELMGTRLIARDAEIRYRFSDSGDGYVEIEVESSWLLENVSTNSEDYQQIVTFERRQAARVVELRCDSDDPRLTYHLQGDNLLSQSPDHPNMVQAVGPVQRIPPRTPDRGPRLRIGSRTVTRQPAESK